MDSSLDLGADQASASASSSTTQAPQTVVLNPEAVLDIFCTPTGSKRLNDALGISSGLEDLKRRFDPVVEKLQSLEHRQDLQDTKIMNIEETCSSKFLEVRNKQHGLNKRLLDLERAQRSCNLKISGLPTPPNDADLPQMRDHMVDSFIDRVVRAGLRDVSKEDIATARVVRVQGQPGPVLQIKLANEAVKDKIYNNRKLFKMFRGENEQIYVNEDLLKVDAAKMSKARKEMKDGRWASVWSFHGKVFAKAPNADRPTCLSDSA